MTNAIMAGWINTLFKLITPILPLDFVGSIEINVFKGGISNINIRQSYKQEVDQ